MPSTKAASYATTLAAVVACSALLVSAYLFHAKKFSSSKEAEEAASADAGWEVIDKADAPAPSSADVVASNDVPSPAPVISSSSFSTSSSTSSDSEYKVRDAKNITIVYSTTTGTCKSLAQSLAFRVLLQIPSFKGKITSSNSPVKVVKSEDFDWWDQLLNHPSNTSPPTSKYDTPIVIFVIPTWDEGSACDTGKALLQGIADIAQDWRVDPNHLKYKLKFAVYGVGSSAYDNETFCKPAKDLNRYLLKLGGTPINSVGMGDVESGDIEAEFEKWGERLVPKIAISAKRKVKVTDKDKAVGVKRVVGMGVEKVAAVKVTAAAAAVASEEVVPKKVKEKAEKAAGGCCSSSSSSGDGEEKREAGGGLCACKSDSKSEPKAKAKEGGGCCSSKDKGDEGESSSGGCGCSSKAKPKGGLGAEGEEFDEEEYDGGGCCNGGDSDDDDYETHEGFVSDEEDPDEDFSAAPPSDDDESDGESAEESEDETDGQGGIAKKKSGVVDLEDMGATMKTQSDEMEEEKKSSEPKEMTTPAQAKALKKEGYKLIGTHSAVKMCRWTKHQLRGRGGCYKHTFYGITSYQCMEATPSLACANKCVFCWRHHKNPVGRTWRWKVDDPLFIVAQAVKEHIGLIKEAKGIPGVLPERWRQAHTVRHCALSLVGEPIMYPRINEFLQELHARKISTFLVTNAQHPDAIETLVPVTQLYVSVDAPTPASLEAIDRPLFKDAWSRLRRSLTMLRDRDQRTVARLTIVKGWNSDEIDGYAELMALGQVSFIEVKGVTFCGTSDASTLNMSNSPWHHEVIAFTEKLRKRLEVLHLNENNRDPPPLYGMACEHKHSCSVLLARVDQFAYNDPITGVRRWKTWMDYPKFQELAQKNRDTNGEFKFGVTDYLTETPAWAEFGSNSEGFDPTDLRHRRKNKTPKYAKYDEEGVPTHDHNDVLLESEVREGLLEKMEKGIKAFKENQGQSEGEGKDEGKEKDLTKVTLEKAGERKGERVVDDPRLMFRGLTITDEDVAEAKEAAGSVVVTLAA